MGGKSSKANDKFIDKSLQEPARGKESQQYDRSNSMPERRKPPRSNTPPAPAWSKKSQEHSRGRDQRTNDRTKPLETSWGKTSFNTFDLHSYGKPSSQSHNDLSNKENYEKFSNFKNITNKREEKEKREKEKALEEALRNKPKTSVSSPKKRFSSRDEPSKTRRRNSLPLENNQTGNTHNRSNKLVSKSSPQKKRLPVNHNSSAERRISDVSTLSLSENTVPTNRTFKPIRQGPNYNYGGNKSSKAAVSVYSKNTNNNYNSKNRYNERTPERRITTPPKVHPESVKLGTQARRQPAAFSRINSLTIGSR